MRNLSIVCLVPALLLVLLQHCSVHAFVPPKPGSDLALTYEPVHVYRANRNITFDYRPKAMHPETCRYLSELDCQDADESMQRHQQRHRNSQRTLAHDRKRRLVEEQQQPDSSSNSIHLQLQPQTPQFASSEDELQYHQAEFETLIEQEEQQDRKDDEPRLRGSSITSTTTSRRDEEEQDDSTTKDVHSLQLQPPAQPEHYFESDDDDDDDEELQYRMAEFQTLLARFTAEYTDGTGGTVSQHADELEELEALLRDRNQTLAEVGRELQSKNQDDQRTDPAATTGRNPRVGTFNVLVLLLRFSDHQNRKLPNKYEYQILWNLRIRKWLMDNSYNNYDAFFDVQPWKKTDNSEKHYAFGQSGRVAGFQEAYWPLLDDLDNDPDWSWNKYDVDDNGLLDNIIILHSGYAAEEGGEDCTNGREYLDRIWSHAFSDSNGWRNTAGTYGVEGYMVASALDLTCDSAPSRMGVMTHEYMHTFYLIDLYDYTFEGRGVGQFDIMAYPYGFANDGYIPGSLSVWAKQAVDWLTCDELSSSGTFTLGPAALGPACLKIPLLGTNEAPYEEYLLVENRQQVGFDVGFWKPGVVIYHIDDAADEQYDRGYPGQGNWPNTGDHYQVAVLQADGNYDLEKGNNLGDEGDLFLPGMKLTPNNDGQTFPSTDSYQYGFIQKTGVTIEILEASGTNFDVKVTLSGRSGSDRADSVEAFPTPVKEDHTEAKAQFEVPDGEGSSISGTVPQLPWREQFLEGTTKSSAGMSIRSHWWSQVAALSVILGPAMIL